MKILRKALLFLRSAVLLVLCLHTYSTAVNLNSDLISAAGKGDIDTVKKLLDQGADVNSKIYGDYSALMAVAGRHRNNAEIVKLLLDKGADVNAKTSEGLTPLLQAARNGSAEIVKLLLDKGADPNAKDSNNKNALTYAAWRGYKEIVKLLLDKGAVINAEVKENNTIHQVIFEKENSDINTLAEGNNAFAVNLYNRLKTQDGNLFFSPYSISTVLTMVYSGARENTEKQIAETLSFPFDQKKLHPAFTSLANKLNSLQENSKIELNAANALWAQKDYVFLKEFLDLNKLYYDAEPANVDFINDSESARLRINKWVEEKTKNKIKDLVKPGMIDPLTRLVLTNVIYFKSDWAYKFGKHLTKAAPFKLLSGKSIMVNMMMNYEGTYGYGENLSLQILELPYEGNNASMIILLPKKDDGLIELEKKINIADIQEWTKSLNKLTVNIYLPRFKIDSEFDLSKVIVSMGMSDAFDEFKADFSGIDGTKNLFISRVIHKTFVDVNEEGTEAGAATGGYFTYGGQSEKPPVFNADHPFIFLIRDNWSGSILFLGRVAEPTLLTADDIKYGLIFAAKRGDIDTVKWFLAEGADVNAKEADSARTALMNAAKKGNIDIVKLLLDKGADVNAETSGGVTALMEAAGNANIEIVKLLLKEGADVNAKEAGSARTVMISAAEKGNTDIVKLLLDKGSDVNAKKIDGATALMAAAGNGNTDLVKLLLDKGADVNAKEVNSARTALLIAVEKDNAEIVKLLLDEGAETIEGVTSLLEAARKGNTKIVKLLLDKGSDVNAKEAGSARTALMYVAKNGNAELVKLLLDKGADVNTKTIDGSTALMEAAGKDSVVIVKLLLDKGAEVNAKNSDGANVLMKAAETNYAEIVKLLLENGADVNAKDNDNNTALIYAARNRNYSDTEIVKLLLENGADVNARSDNGLATALIYSANKSFREMLELLKKAGAEETVVNNLLTSAAEKGDLNKVNLLLDKGEDVNARDKKGCTALIKASWYGYIEMVKLLLDNGADINARSNDGLTALMVAAGNENVEIVKLLLEEGADVNAKDKFGKKAVMHLDAGEKNYAEIVKLFQDNEMDVNAKKKRDVFALMTSAVKGDKEAVKLLLDSGTDVNAKTYYGSTVLMKAVGAGSIEMVKLLLDKGADLNIRSNDTGVTALMLAVEDGVNETVKLLLEKGADVNLKTKDYGFTALMKAAEHGDTEILKLLLEKGANVNARTVDGSTALMQAAENGRVDAVKLLLGKGAEVNLGSENGLVTALMYAEENGCEEIVKLLKDAGAEKTVVYNGLDLISAVENGDINIAAIFLAKGADVNARDKDGGTALIYAAREGYAEIVKLLLEKGADVNAKDRDGISALITAVWNGHTEAVKLLLEKGADINAKNSDMKTAVAFAVEKGYPEIVKLLLEKGADVNAKDMQGGNILGLAVKQGNKEMIKQLLDKGADVDEKDKGAVTAMIRAETLEKESNDIKVLAEGNNAFAVNLYNRLKTQDGNLFFSPYSISTALAMAYSGARGNTEKQIAGTLSFPLSREQLHPAFGNLMKKINSLQENGKIKLNIANALWAQKDHVFLKEFLDLNKLYYNAEPSNVDFNNSELTRLRINKWVEEKTNNKIKDLIQPGMINADTRFVLTNAVYFKADWVYKFKKSITKDEPFKLLSGKLITVKMMAQKERYGYKENSSLQILELPYKGDKVSMIVLLPKKDDGLIEIEKNLNIAGLQEWTGNLNKRAVEVYFPRFKINSEFSLSEVLISMGMSDAFGSSADFSGMDGTKSLFISTVIHKAFVDVNEEGTVAAAATAMMMKSGGGIPEKPPVFKADHPFIFLIRDNWSGSILFLGRVTDPNASISE